MPKSLAALLTLVSLVAAGPPPLTLLTEENPPYNFADPDTGEVKGIVATTVRQLMKEAGIGYGLQLLPWRRAYRRTETNANTCIFSANKTPAREALFQWVGPLAGSEGGWGFFMRPDSGIKISTLEEASKFIVAGVAGNASAAEFEQLTGNKILGAPDEKTAMLLLYHGRSDLVLTGTGNAAHAAGSLDVDPPKLALLWRSYGLYLACNLATDPALIKTLNRISAAQRQNHSQHTTGTD